MSKLPDSSSLPLSDVQLQSITGQIFVGQAVLVAHELGLFKMLCKTPLSIHELSMRTGLHERAIQAMLSCAGAMDLVECKQGQYQLSHLGKVYLDENNPGYYGKVLDLLIQQHEIMDYSSIKRALMSNKSLLNPEGSLFTPSDELSSTQSFVDALHYKSFKPAFHWASMIDLNGCQQFVDIGGGSGIHTIAACLHNPSLQGIVCDRQFILPFTQKYIEQFHLENRIHALPIDMWNDTLPAGDVYFLGDIFHDWEIDNCVLLAQKCFQGLPSGGRIILHEMLFNVEKTGPFLTAAYNMKMVAWTRGQQLGVKEIEDILYRAGFKKIQIVPSLGNWSIVIGVKK